MVSVVVYDDKLLHSSGCNVSRFYGERWFPSRFRVSSDSGRDSEFQNDMRHFVK